MPPDLGYIKINYDSSFTLQERKSISGLIARNEEGLIMGACTYNHADITNAFTAEAHACEKAVWFAQELRFRRVQIEGYLLTIVKRVHATTIDRSIISPIIANIKQRIGFFEHIRFIHVKREANSAAYTLAKERRFFPDLKVWIEEPPPVVERTAQAERLAFTRSG